MPKVFVSWYDGFANPQADEFNKLLEQQGFELDHSPSSPHSGYQDPRWENWYPVGLPQAIEQADIFIAVMTEIYNSSWMMVEYHEAYRSRFNKGKPLIFFVKFCGDEYLFGMLETYLQHSIVLPGNSELAINMLLSHL
jgi:hypothetical protein